MLGAEEFQSVHVLHIHAILLTTNCTCMLLDLTRDMLFQWGCVLLVWQLKINDGISQVVFVDACQCLSKSSVTVQKESGCSTDIQLDHQFLHKTQLQILQSLLIYTIYYYDYASLPYAMTELFRNLSISTSGC